MVPGSTLRYGAIFWSVARRPRDSSRQPMEAAARPLPSEDTTPPVTKMYFADIFASPNFDGIGWTCGVCTSDYCKFGGGLEGRICCRAAEEDDAASRIGEAGAGGI